MTENEFELINVEDDDAPVIPEQGDGDNEEPDKAPEKSQTSEARIAELCGQVSDLQKELTLSKIKVSLLISGILREKLDEAAAIASGLCAAGKSPEAASAEVAEEYPHLKAIQREIPQFAAGSSGSADGFSAIRKIFSGR